MSTTFAFTGRTRQGQPVSGERVAETADAAVAALRREQILVTKIDAVKRRAAAAKRAAKGGKAVPAQNLAIFVRQFSVMIDAGLPLVQCLEILGKQEEDKNFAATILAVRTDVEGGSGLADAMAKHPRAFDPLFTNMIAAGEAGGILDTILKRLATYIEKNVKLKGQVKSAMMYPIAVVVIASVVVGGILWKVIPTFASLFEGLGAVLPLPTRIVIAMSNSLVTFLPFIILGVVGGSFLFRQYYSTDGGRRVVDGVALKAPVRHPPQDRRGQVLPHAEHAPELGRPDPRRAQYHREDGRQRGRRGRGGDDPSCDRARRIDLGPVARDRGVPGDGHADDQRW